MSPAHRRPRKSRLVSYDTARELALALPGVDEATSYGTPALKVKGKLIARLKEDGETLVVRSDFLDRDLRMRADPATFFITDHYRNYPYLLVRLSSVGVGDLTELLALAWRRVAPARLVRELDQRRELTKASER